MGACGSGGRTRLRAGRFAQYARDTKQSPAPGAVWSRQASIQAMSVETVRPGVPVDVPVMSPSHLVKSWLDLLFAPSSKERAPLRL
jgi:hypothetical protein